MTTQHTPTPWIADGKTIWGPEDGDGEGSIISERIADADDAAYIVLAVNAHEGLIQIAKWVASFDEDCTGDGTPTCVCHGCEGARARAALAQAKGETP